MTTVASGVRTSTLHSLNSAVLTDVKGTPIEVQARRIAEFEEPKPWLSAVKVSGISSGAAKDLLTRLSAALAQCGHSSTMQQLVLNFHPAGLRYAGQSLDLPAAIVLLQAARQLPALEDYNLNVGDFLVFGALDAHGECRRTPGALALALAAMPGQRLIVPEPIAKECTLVLARNKAMVAASPDKWSDAGHVHGVSHLSDLIRFFNRELELESTLSGGALHYQDVSTPPDFADIRGQAQGKQAAVIAIAGGHSCLSIGPPGVGKSYIAKACTGLLPPLSPLEQVELSAIYSVAGLLSDGHVVSRCPCRIVHHSASVPAVIGGGTDHCKPGELSLAHRGILLLDELPEFRRDVLEALRQPLEDGVVRIARAGFKVELPSRVSLFATMNPCPCGYYGDPSGKCRCQKAAIRNYRRKVSGPILDRIDLCVTLENLSVDERMGSGPAGPSTAELREKVLAARQRQEARGCLNAAADAVELHRQMDAAAQAEFEKRATERALSPRSMDRLCRVARTVADLRDSDVIESADLRVAGRLTHKVDLTED